MVIQVRKHSGHDQQLMSSQSVKIGVGDCRNSGSFLEDTMTTKSYIQ